MVRVAGLSDLHLHGDAKTSEAIDESHGHLLFVAMDKILAPQIVVLDSIAKHVVRRGQHRAGHGEDGLLRAATALNPQKLRSKISIPFFESQPRRRSRAWF